MNREILFKGKRLDNGQWVEGNYGFFKSVNGNEKMHHITTEDGKAIRIDPTTLCQFTGLKDKNGNKIWENDLVGYHSKYQEKYYYGQVKYGEFNCSCCDGVYGWYFDSEDIREYKNYEVLGNVFDNPELLEKV